MKKLVDFFCPGCDKRLSCDEKHAGEKAECPRCGKEFDIPTRAEAETEKFRRSTFDLEDKKYAEWLKSRLKLIQSGEKKHLQPDDPGAAMPPWLKKAIERTKKSEEKNPLEEIELLDMDKPNGGKKE